MPRSIYCWRCEKELPMLTEAEWAVIAPHLSRRIEEIVQYRNDHGAELPEALRHASSEALKVYEELTGYQERNVDAIPHHRLSIYGPPCHACGKPLRTPRARFCAACGATRAETAEGGS